MIQPVNVEISQHESVKPNKIPLYDLMTFAFAFAFKVTPGELKEFLMEKGQSLMNSERNTLL